MDAWDNNTMPAGQADNDALMAQIRESLLANLGQTIDAICKGTMQQMAKASRMSAENTVLWVVDRICRQTLDRLREIRTLSTNRRTSLSMHFSVSPTSPCKCCNASTT